MPITMSSTLNHIYRKLGLSHIPNPLLDDHYETLIIEECLPTFSKYFPYMYKVIVDPKVHAVPGEFGLFYMIPEDPSIEIIGIRDFHRVGGAQGMFNGDLEYTRTQNPYDVLALQSIHNISSMAYMPDTFLYHNPNIIEIFPKSTRTTDKLIVNTKAVHPIHLATINFNLREEWYKLVEYDAKISAYEILKNVDGAQTPFGNIELKIDRWADAEDKREQLLELWHNKAIKEPNRRKIFFG